MIGGSPANVGAELAPPEKAMNNEGLIAVRLPRSRGASRLPKAGGERSGGVGGKTMTDKLWEFA